jgi:hypothetical protein
MQSIEDAHQSGLVYDVSGKYHFSVIQQLYFQAFQPVSPARIEVTFDMNFEEFCVSTLGRDTRIRSVIYIVLVLHIYNLRLLRLGNIVRRVYPGVVFFGRGGCSPARQKREGRQLKSSTTGRWRGYRWRLNRKA